MPLYVVVDDFDLDSQPFRYYSSTLHQSIMSHNLIYLCSFLLIFLFVDLLFAPLYWVRMFTGLIIDYIFVGVIEDINKRDRNNK